MSRDPSDDVPRRIYRSTVERIQKHLDNMPVQYTTKGKPKKMRYNFNAFLIELLDLYEELKTTPIYYVNNYYEDPSEARGEALQEAVRAKIPLEKVKKPMMMIAVGEGE